MEFSLSGNELAFLNERMEWVVEPGMFEVMVGGSSVDVQMVMLDVVQG